MLRVSPSTQCDTSSQPRVVTSSVPDLADATIRRLIDECEITSDSKVLMSVPAGPNRARNLVPALSIASRVNELAGARLTVEVAIDDNENLHNLITSTTDEGVSSLRQIQQYFFRAENNRIDIKGRIQPVTNSVMETVTAMREAADMEATHLLAPRSSKALAARVSRGLVHYAPSLAGGSLEVASAPAHSLTRDDAPGHGKRSALEWISYLAGEATNVISPALFEQLVERKGIFGSLARFAQTQKLKNF